MARANLDIIIEAKDNASGVLGRIGGALGSLGTIAAGVAVTGLAAIAGGLAAVGTTGLGFNAQIEEVTARLNAFTGDAAKTAEILEMIKDRAAATPFEFMEIANAAASLMPIAKQTGIALEDLVANAEVLAASNPAQGMEGAAFALKEALGGDFVSIVERFNLPRKFIKELKEKGVPEIEIVTEAMREMGFSTALVTNLAETAAGRWSTLKDNFTNMAGVVTQPIFDTFSAGLGSLNAWFTANEGLVLSYAQAVAANIQFVIDTFSDLASGDIEGAMARSTAILMKMGLTKEQSFAIVDTVRTIFNDITEAAAAFQAGGLFGSRSGSFGSEGLLNAIGIPPNIIDTLQTAFDNITAVVDAFKTGGLFGNDVATPGGTAQTGGLLRALGLSDEEVASVQESIDKITIAAGKIGEAFGKIFAAGSEAGIEQTNALVQLLETLAVVMEKIAAAGDVAAQIRAIVEATGGIGAATNAIVEGGTGLDLARAGEMRPVAGQFGGTNMDFARAGEMRPAAGQFGGTNMDFARAGEMQPTPGQFGGTFDFGPFITAITNAITGAPPPVVNVSANLDGAQIANSVSIRLGSDSQGLGRIGGHGTLNR